MISRNPSSRRHVLLFAAVAFLLIAGFLDPRILHRLACHAGILTVAFMVVCAFLAAKGVRRLAEVFFRGSGRPWYARPGVVIFGMVTDSVLRVLHPELRVPTPLGVMTIVHSYAAKEINTCLVASIH